MRYLRNFFTNPYVVSFLFGIGFWSSLIGSIIGDDEMTTVGIYLMLYGIFSFIYACRYLYIDRDITASKT